MTNPSLVRWRRLFGVLQSVSIGVAGLCLMAGCVTVYTSAESYSRQAVSDTFATIAVPVYICLALTLLGFVWDVFAPAARKAPKPPKAYGQIRRRLLAGTDPAAGDPAVRGAIAAERTRRRWLAIVRTVLVCGGGGVFLMYALQGAHFHPTDINGSVIRAMWVALPCFGAPAGFSVFAAVAGERSLRREIELLRTLPRTAATSNDTPPAKSTTALTVVRVALLALALGALICGWLAGGTVDVLAKAINICTECIGLG